GLLSTAVLIMARTISEGNAMKYFTAVLGIAVSTTLLSYLAIFPALWRLRVTHPDHPRPYRAPWAKFLSVWLTLIVAFASVQLVAPGLGVDWFGDDFRPDGWAQSERWKFLFTEAIPVLFFMLVGVLFWVAGGRTRKHAANARG
ncbi:MAG: APC family permease, partial [Actinomycetes bacterium]